MVDYIGVASISGLVEEMGVGTFMEQLALVIEADYARWAEFEKVARLASHSSQGVIELMPISDGRQYSFKYVNGHPGNTLAGLLTVTAFGVLAAVDTGYPLLLSELTVTTALRTAAMSALAAKWLARPDSRTLALIGNGAQSEFQAIAMRRAFRTMGELRLYDTDPVATAKTQRNLRALPELKGVSIISAASIADAVRGADIVTTATADKRNATILEPSMISPGMHLNAVGGDCPGKTELHPKILQRKDCRVFVEYEAQSRVEGEIQQMASDFPVTEFAEVVSGAKAGRSTAGEVTVFDSVGFALEDYSALRFLHELLPRYPKWRGRLDLIPDLDDPKDLFGGALGGRRKVAARRVA